MWIRRKQEEVAALHEHALELVEAGDLDRADAIARELETLGWSGAFEVLALAARKRGDLAGAIAHLDRGVSLAPDVWLLHQLRGNLLDQAERRDDALAAYDAALACPDAWASSVRYNRAVTLLAAGRPGDALADAEHVVTEASDTPFAVAALAVAIDALAALSRHDDAVAIVEHALAAAGDEDTQGALTALLARALLAAGRGETELGREELRAACARAIEAGAGGSEVAAVLHALAPALAVRAYRASLDVTASDLVEGASGYMRVVRVGARDEAEARALAVSLEPERVRASATVELAAEGDADRVAVLDVSGRAFYA